jgi:hypothetical protein
MTSIGDLFYKLKINLESYSKLLNYNDLEFAFNSPDSQKRGIEAFNYLVLTLEELLDPDHSDNRLEAARVAALELPALKSLAGCIMQRLRSASVGV